MSPPDPGKAARRNLLNADVEHDALAYALDAHRAAINHPRSIFVAHHGSQRRSVKAVARLGIDNPGCLYAASI